MDCIPYINDLQVEIEILKDVAKNGNCDIDLVNKQINEKEILIQKCRENLEKLSINSIEQRIYLKILEGKKPSVAIKEIADENYINDIKPSSPSKLWNYYKKVKEIL